MTMMDLSDVAVVSLKVFNYESDIQLFWILFGQKEQDFQIWIECFYFCNRKTGITEGAKKCRIVFLCKGKPCSHKCSIIGKVNYNYKFHMQKFFL